MGFVLSLFLALVMGLCLGIGYNLIEQRKIDKYWKDWELNSFEYRGGRYNKSVFYVDESGHIQFKD